MAGSVSFFDTWDTYKKVVASNCMFHREIGAKLHEALSGQFNQKPFSLLDLGCGDAATLVPLLKGLRLTRYKGVDLSQAALVLAAENLESLNCPVQLDHTDILTALAENETYDVIHASFVLHHLPSDQKAEFFRRVAQRLNPGGILLLTDVVREEEESLDTYLNRYCGWLKSEWPSLDMKEKDMITDHIMHNDFPEPYSILDSQARAAGLSADVPLARYLWHWLLCFNRATA
jgi:cyclopropane fatty-acyl-phospholipid synthase-like methyltransferase